MDLNCLHEGNLLVLEKEYNYFDFELFVGWLWIYKAVEIVFKYLRVWDLDFI